MKKINKKGQCGKCKSENFFLLESIGHKGWIDEESKELVLKQTTNGIDSIECDNCQTIYSEEDFTKAGFSVNFS